MMDLNRFLAGLAGSLQNVGISKYAEGGMVHGPGSGTSDDVPAIIYGPGNPQPAALSDGEFVITAEAVRNIGGGDPDKGAKMLNYLMQMAEQDALDDEMMAQGLQALVKANT